MKNLIAKLSDIVSSKKTVETKIDANDIHAKNYLHLYCEKNNIKWQLWELHLIEVKTEIDKIVVTIHVGKPGYFFKSKSITTGNYVDPNDLGADIIKYLTEKLNAPVQLEAVLFNVWK